MSRPHLHGVTSSEIFGGHTTPPPFCPMLINGFNCRLLDETMMVSTTS
jgi:hypothetical protein